MGCEACQLCQLTTGVSVKFRKCHSCYWFRNRANQSLSRIQNIHGYPIFKRSIHLRWCKTSSTRRRFWATKSSSVSAGSLFCPPIKSTLTNLLAFSRMIFLSAPWNSKTSGKTHAMPWREAVPTDNGFADPLPLKAAWNSWKKPIETNRNLCKDCCVLTCFCKSSYKKTSEGFNGCKCPKLP